MAVFVTESPEATFSLGKELGARLDRGDVICLSGDLGAGKTLFTQGVAAGLGVGEGVTSPTFTILQVYEDGRCPIYHFDLYRLEIPQQLEDIGFEEYSRPDGVAIIEWADKFAAEMPEEHLWIELKINDEAGRVVTMSPHGARYVKLCEEMNPVANTSHGHGHSRV